MLSDYSTFLILSFVFLSFFAGFIDAVVGGGGLIQFPALLINLPKTPLPVLMGTNKIAALCGTTVSAYQYTKKIKFNFKLLLIVSFCAAISSFAGAKIIGYINVKTLKPMILGLLVLMAIYTFVKKDLGSLPTKSLPFKKQAIYGAIIGLIVGFYDGFFGPGTGTFFVLGFVVVLGFEFVEASAYAKLINCVTNISALIVFVRDGNYLLELSILLGICNVFGNFVGAKLALKKGNQFVRIVFLFVLTLMIIRYGYDVFV